MLIFISFKKCNNGASLTYGKLMTFFINKILGVLLWHSRLNIQHCHCSSLGSCCGLGLIPGLETSAWSKKEKRKNQIQFYPYILSFSCFFFFLFFFLGPHSWHMEVPRLEVESELQLQAYATATATWDPSCVCNLHHSSGQF